MCRRIFGASVVTFAFLFAHASMGHAYSNSTTIRNVPGNVVCGIYQNIEKDGGVAAGVGARIWYSGNVNCLGAGTWDVVQQGSASLVDASGTVVDSCSAGIAVQPVTPGLNTGDCDYLPVTWSEFYVNTFTVSLTLRTKPPSTWIPTNPNCDNAGGVTITCTITHGVWWPGGEEHGG